MWGLALRAGGSLLAKMGIRRAATTAVVEAAEIEASQAAKTGLGAWIKEWGGKIARNPFKASVAAGGATALAEGTSMAARLGELSKSFLPLALISGVLAGGYLLLTGGKHKPRADEAGTAAISPQTLSPEERLLAPQQEMPYTVGGTVTASYPAAVGDVASHMMQPSPGDGSWQARVGAPRTPVASYAALESVADSHLAAQEARAAEAGAAQNTVA